MGLTYDQSEQVKAWHEHDVGGKVRSMTVIPDPNTSSDMLFISRETVISERVLKLTHFIARTLNE
jgi:hypothetical protein